MSVQARMVVGSVQWLEAYRQGAFANRPPVPWAPPPKPRPAKITIMPPKVTPTSYSLLEAYRGSPCPYCKQPMWSDEGRKPSRDHVYPRRLGGTLAASNCLIVCSPCNGDKGSMTLEQWGHHLTITRDRRAQIVWAIVTLKRYQQMPPAAMQRQHALAQVPVEIARVPIEYDDSKAQAAFEAVYRNRKHLLRV